MNDETGRTSADGGGRLILVGMMGSGKTTVGRLLAERSHRPYLDNDDLVRAMSGREPWTIRAEDGEAALHDIESSAFERAMAAPPPVIVGAAAGVIDDRMWLRASGARPPWCGCAPDPRRSGLASARAWAGAWRPPSSSRAM